MKRLIPLILAMLLSVAMLTACSGENAGNITNAPTDAPTTETGAPINSIEPSVAPSDAN